MTAIAHHPYRLPPSEPSGPDRLWWLWRRFLCWLGRHEHEWIAVREDVGNGVWRRLPGIEHAESAMGCYFTAGPFHWDRPMRVMACRWCSACAHCGERVLSFDCGNSPTSHVTRMKNHDRWKR